jgi:hypothetical protein
MYAMWGPSRPTNLTPNRNGVHRSPPPLHPKSKCHDPKATPSQPDCPKIKASLPILEPPTVRTSRQLSILLAPFLAGPLRLLRVRRRLIAFFRAIVTWGRPFRRSLRAAPTQADKSISLVQNLHAI